MVFEGLMRILFGGQVEVSDQEYSEKLAGLTALLGPQYDAEESTTGLTNLYYFAQCLPGTALATAHLIQTPSSNVKRRRRTIPYELVAFTKLHVAHLDSADAVAAFQERAVRIAYVLDTVGRYSTVDTLKPGSCCELPARRGEKAGHLVFLEFTRDNARLTIAGRTYTLLLCIEVFAPEMAYARSKGVAALVEKLEAAGYYPYSDLDRTSVV